MRTARARNHGLTLLELMVVLGLTAIILTLAYQIMSNANEVWTKQHKQTDSARQGWKLAMDISKQLRAALPPEQLSGDAVFEGTDGITTLLAALPQDEGRDPSISSELAAVPLHDDVIRFPTAQAPADRGPDGPGMVQYRLMRNEDDHIVGVEMRSAPAGTPLEKGTASPKATRARSLNFEYLTGKGEWVAKWTDTRALPRAVRIEVGCEGPMQKSGVPSVLRFFTTVYLQNGSRILK